MRKIFLLISTILLIASCNNTSKKETELLKKENELLKKEIELNKHEKETIKSDVKPNKKIDVKKETQKLFDIYSLKIEKSNGARFEKREIMTGDLNDDGLEDSLVFFILTPEEGGNMIVGIEMAVYLNKGNRMEVVTSYNPEKTFKPIEIKNNKIHLIEYEYAEDDYPNYPSIENHKYLILRDNKLISSRD
jgi:hypothetical protein